MALKTLINKLEDVSEGFREHYSPVDPNDVSAGFTLETDKADERAGIGEFRGNNINLQKERDNLKAQLERFEGIDPKKHKKAMEALSKIESSHEQKLIEEGKIDEVFSNRTTALKNSYDEQLNAKTNAYKELVSQHERLNSEHAKMLIGGQVQEVMAQTKLKPKGTGMRDILSRVHDTFKMKEGKVVAMKGDQQLFGGDGNPLTISEHISKMATVDTHLFESSGGGGASGENSKGAKNSGGMTVIDLNDTAAVGRHLEAIAKGKGTVKFPDAEG